MGSLRRGEAIDIYGRPLFGPVMVDNPFLDYPADLDCWCGSGVKSAECCLPKMSKKIPRKDAAIGDAYMKYVREQLAKREGWKPERQEKKLILLKPVVE
jgi:hypothetical protein